MVSPADVRGKVRKLGPRALTFCANPVTAEGSVLLVNCPECPAFESEDGVILGECAGEPPVPGSGTLLVAGWYRAVTNCPVWIQQLNPANACSADPLNCGNPLNPGESFEFYVDLSCVDGVIAVLFCAPSLIACPPQCICTPADCPCFVTINRIDTVLTMAQTGDNFSAGSPSGSLACGEGPGPGP